VGYVDRFIKEAIEIRLHPNNSNPLKLKLIQIICKNFIHASKRMPLFTITKIIWLILFKDIIAVYCKNHTKRINAKCNVIDY
jgi:hypothetical protein